LRSHVFVQLRHFKVLFGTVAKSESQGWKALVQILFNMGLMISTKKSLPEKKKKERKKSSRKSFSSHLPELQLQNSSPIFTICTALRSSVGFPKVQPIWKVKY